ncbi:MAG: c-type cytochrome [Myxococcota bacterium]|nr:c-type cytochrome [Myxococcota bacterium]
MRARMRAIKFQFHDAIAQLVMYGCILLLMGFGQAFAKGPAVEGLGCGNCHLGGVKENPFAGQIPNLRDAGVRYTDAFLHTVLQNGQNRRKRGAVGRMPVFPMSPDERSALVGFLNGRSVSLPEDIKAMVKGPSGRDDVASKRGRQVFDAYGCIGCHAADGAGGGVGPSLDAVSKKLKPAWVESYLIDPKRIDPTTSMVNLFYQRRADGYEPVRRDRDVRQDLTDLMSYLYRDGVPVDSAVRPPKDGSGKRIYKALRCANCHELSKPKQFAPDLSKVANHFKSDYLSAYLTRPVPRRPFGAQAGDGSRMPNFNLSTTEVSEITTWMKAKAGRTKTRSPLKTLSAYATKKAGRLLAEKMSCLGCHQWGGEGGRIGPQLMGAGGRLTRQHIHNVLFNTRATLGHSVMPQVRGRPTVKTMTLIQALLEQSQTGAPETEYLSLIEHETLDRQASGRGQRNYETYCATCHGIAGEQNGFNAGYLPVKPARLASADVLSRRPDDTLYDVLAVGGFVLGKSHRMPPWGDTLTREEIWEVVQYLRKLCNCSQPTWAEGAP